jgi:hypothetical protein
MRSVFEVFRILIVYGEVVQQLPLLDNLVLMAVSASPKIGQKEVVKITNFNNFKDKLRDEKEIHRITNCISH